MAIETKPDKSTKAEKLPPLQFRNNPEVKKRIDDYKAANPDDVTYYTRLVKEHPERAIDAMFYKDMQRHENEMRLVNKQLPQARAFYNAQAPEAKARIDADLQGVEPFYRDKAFVSAALRQGPAGAPGVCLPGSQHHAAWHGGWPGRPDAEPARGGCASKNGDVTPQRTHEGTENNGGRGNRSFDRALRPHGVG